jgi:hypothetical protein
MTRKKNTGKLAAKAVVPAAPVVDMGEGDMPDALSLIKSLTETREGTEWNVRVYLVPNGGMGRGNTSKQQFLFDVQLEELPQLENQLAELYPGGGIFRVMIRADNQLVKIVTLDVAPRPGYRPPPPHYLAPAAPTAPEAIGGDRMELFLARMMEVQERSAQQTRDLIAAMANNTPKGPTLIEQIQLLTEVQKLTPKGAQENTMELFQKGMDFAAKLYEARGSEGGGTSWMDVVKEALSSPTVKDIIASMAAAGAQATAAAGAPALPPPGLLSPQNPQAMQAVDTLLRQAVLGVDPKIVAGQVWGSVPQAIMHELEQQPDVVGYIVQRFPQAAAHRPWLTALVAELWEEEETGAAPRPSPTLNPDAVPPTQQPQT